MSSKLINLKCKFKVTEENVIHGMGLVSTTDILDTGVQLWSETPLLYNFTSPNIQYLENTLNINPSTINEQITKRYEEYKQQNLDILRPGDYIIYNYKINFKTVNTKVDLKIFQLEAERNNLSFYYWLYNNINNNDEKGRDNSEMDIDDSTTTTARTDSTPLHPKLPFDQWQLLYQFVEKRFTVKQFKDWNMTKTMENIEYSQEFIQEIDPFLDIICASVDNNYYNNNNNNNNNIDNTTTTRINNRYDILQTYKLIENLYVRMLNNLSGDVEGYGIYRFGSFMNHSCIPNVYVSFDTTTGNMNVYNTVPIRVGDELTMAYHPSVFYDKHAPRQNALRDALQGKDCACSLCKKEVLLMELMDKEKQYTDAYEMTARMQYMKEIDDKSVQMDYIKELLNECGINDNNNIKANITVIKEKLDKITYEKNIALQVFKRLSCVFFQSDNMDNWFDPDIRQNTICSELKYDSFMTHNMLTETTYLSFANLDNPVAFILGWNFLKKIKPLPLSWTKTAFHVSFLRLCLIKGWNFVISSIQTNNNHSLIITELFIWLLSCYNNSVCITGENQVDYMNTTKEIRDIITNTWIRDILPCSFMIQDHILVEIAILSFLSELKEIIGKNNETYYNKVWNMIANNSPYKNLRNNIFPDINKLKINKINDKFYKKIVEDTFIKNKHMKKNSNNTNTNK